MTDYSSNFIALHSSFECPSNVCNNLNSILVSTILSTIKNWEQEWKLHISNRDIIVVNWNQFRWDRDHKLNFILNKLNNCWTMSVYFTHYLSSLEIRKQKQNK